MHSFPSSNLAYFVPVDKPRIRVVPTHLPELLPLIAVLLHADQTRHFVVL